MLHAHCVWQGMLLIKEDQNEANQGIGQWLPQL